MDVAVGFLVKVATELKDRADKVKSNKKQCCNLAGRSFLLVNSLPKKCPLSLEPAIDSLRTVLNGALDLVKEFESVNWYKRMFSVNQTLVQFQELNLRLSQCSLDFLVRIPFLPGTRFIHTILPYPPLQVFCKLDELKFDELQHAKDVADDNRNDVKSLQEMQANKSTTETQRKEIQLVLVAVDKKIAGNFFAVVINIQVYFVGQHLICLYIYIHIYIYIKCVLATATYITILLMMTTGVVI